MSDRDEIVQVLFEYASALDRRDGEAAAAMFAKGAVVEVFVRAEPRPRKVSELMEHELVAYIIDRMLPMHLRGEFCRHLISNHVVRVDESEANLEAQFIVVKTTPNRSASTGPTLHNSLGIAEIQQSGSVKTEFSRTDGKWRIRRHCVLNDLDWPEMPLS